MSVAKVTDIWVLNLVIIHSHCVLFVVNKPPLKSLITDSGNSNFKEQLMPLALDTGNPAAIQGPLNILAFKQPPWDLPD